MYVPPGPITGVLGLPGTGKTFIALIAGFEMAEELHLDVVANFSLNARALYYYFLGHGYTWLLSRLLHGGIKVRSCAEGSELRLSEFMQEKGTLYLIDEAGVYLNSRNFKNIPLDFLSDLALNLPCYFRYPIGINLLFLLVKQNCVILCRWLI